jgi:hypothetical protein
MKFKNLPLTYRNGLVMDAIEELRMITETRFDWYHVMLSPDLFRQLEWERGPGNRYHNDMLWIDMHKVIVKSDVLNELPPNSIINIECDDYTGIYRGTTQGDCSCV